jgi:hypothetical protein
MALTGKEFDDLQFTGASFNAMKLTGKDFNEATYKDMAAKLMAFKSLPSDIVIPNEAVREIIIICEPEEPPTKWTKSASEKVFDKFLETITDPVKLAAFALLLEKLLKGLAG